jgi:hypothetical protein
VPNYSDIYPGPKLTKNELLSGINSNVIISFLCIANSEIYGAVDYEETQNRLTSFLTINSPDSDRIFLQPKLGEYKQKNGGQTALWATRYIKLECQKIQGLKNLKTLNLILQQT